MHIGPVGYVRCIIVALPISGWWLWWRRRRRRRWWWLKTDRYGCGDFVHSWRNITLNLNVLEQWRARKKISSRSLIVLLYAELRGGSEDEGQCSSFLVPKSVEVLSTKVHVDRRRMATTTTRTMTLTSCISSNSQPWAALFSDVELPLPLLSSSKTSKSVALTDVELFPLTAAIKHAPNTTVISRRSADRRVLPPEVDVDVIVSMSMLWWRETCWLSSSVDELVRYNTSILNVCVHSQVPQ